MYYWDGEYNSVVRASTQALYKMYKPEEDEEIYEFFKPIGLGETDDEFILQNGRLRTTAYRIYYKTELSKMSLTRQEKLEHIKKSRPSSPTVWEAPGIYTQEKIEDMAKAVLVSQLR